MGETEIVKACLLALSMVPGVRVWRSADEAVGHLVTEITRRRG